MQVVRYAEHLICFLGAFRVAYKMATATCGASKEKTELLGTGSKGTAIRGYWTIYFYGESCKLHLEVLE